MTNIPEITLEQAEAELEAATEAHMQAGEIYDLARTHAEAAYRMQEQAWKRRLAAINKVRELEAQR